MEYQKIINLLDNAINQQRKFRQLDRNKWWLTSVEYITPIVKVNLRI